jgi:hypothetical protein
MNFKKFIFACWFIFFAFLPTNLWAMAPDTLVVPGKKYERGFVHRIFWGTHYRRVWAEPVRVPYLNLQTEHGGLKPTKRGGSYQTKNLRMVNPEGTEYVLRSINKDPSQTLSAKMRDSYIGWLVRDQTSVIHPYGAFIIAHMAEAAGLLHTNPRLFVVPNDPALGEYQKEFANMLVLIEERPEGNQKHNEDFGFSEEVESSRNVLKKLAESNKNRIDARSYLRARLFDMWIGDWSRREDQWRWATFENPSEGKTYKAIPRDRDHAFFKFNDGVFPWLASGFIPSLKSFGNKIENLNGLNKAAAPMDRSILVFLTKDDFRQIADSLKMKLTNTVIENAVRSWPKNIYELDGEEFETKLKRRRDQLSEVAEKYYKMLAKEVEIPGSDEPEIFRLTGQPDGLLVEMIRPNKKGHPDALIASRTFKPKETKVLKIYVLAGKDRFEITGGGNPIRQVQLHDGEGQDSVSFKAEKKMLIQVMDSGDGNEIPKTKKIKVVKYQPKAQEFNGEGWLLRHRLY